MENTWKLLLLASFFHMLAMETAQCFPSQSSASFTPAQPPVFSSVPLFLNLM